MLSTTPQQVEDVNAWSITNFIIKKLKFSAQTRKTTRDFQKKFSVPNLAKIVLTP